ncbi:MAG: hypothetical protein ACJ798_13160 [Phenylobacterium sp.]
MSEPTADLDEAMLARLAGLDLAAAEKVHGKLMAAEEASEIAELGRTYQRCARSLRQTLALKAKLKHDREAVAKGAAPAKPGGVAVARRLKDLTQAVTRIIWDEAERADAPDFLEMLDDMIADECQGDSFCAEPVDDHVARICMAIGLPPEGAEHWRDLPDPPEDFADAEAPEDDPDRRSSG